MADSVQLKTQPRGEFGTANARRLRKKGLLPAVIYGHKEEVVAAQAKSAFNEARFLQILGLAGMQRATAET